MNDVNQLFAEAFEDPDTYLGARPNQHYYIQVLSKPDVIVLAAVHDGQVVGALVGYVLQKLEQARSEIYIYDLAVAEGFRQQGLATSLITETQMIASDIGAWVVYVQADCEEPPAVALYTKLGTREEVLHFDLPPRSRPTN